MSSCAGGTGRVRGVATGKNFAKKNVTRVTSRSMAVTLLDTY